MCGRYFIGEDDLPEKLMHTMWNIDKCRENVPSR